LSAALYHGDQESVVIYRVCGGEAVEIVRREGKDQVCHDFDTRTYGVCKKTEHPGHFSCGSYIEHRCICMPATLNPEELEQREKAFLEENPGWLKEQPGPAPGQVTGTSLMPLKTEQYR
jgi:hypothetical protein